MENESKEVYFVFMNFDPEYERLQADRSKEGSNALNAYLTKKHDKLLAKHFRANTYIKRSSLAIIDGFPVELTEHQANILRSANEVRLVEKNQELS
ncbi:hypothetical protein LUZ62_076099 [Rhynchospora pubera]|uniref:Inhibitor I9 domain-containing protein n=1 Tax=Rhynchospora pubera TaxID=906938 RepID=A0AAV8DCH1_9POAL|nr:hypothetical protein LUZ62_076099 [Rhynchospora pubera]